jgi:hypothetical protein
MMAALKDLRDGLPDGERLLMLTGVRLGESAVRDRRIALSCSRNGAECGQGWFQHQTYDRTDGRPTYFLINEEEETRIRELIALSTFPDGWSGTEPGGEVLLPFVYQSGFVQPLLFDNLLQ